jgi:hypothetical protein
VIVAGGEGRKRDRGQNYISRRYAWITYITKVPVWPRYVSLSFVEAESGSLFDTLIKLILKIPRGKAIYVAFTGRVGIHCYRVE